MLIYGKSFVSAGANGYNESYSVSVEDLVLESVQNETELYKSLYEAEIFNESVGDKLKSAWDAVIKFLGKIKDAIVRLISAAINKIKSFFNKGGNSSDSTQKEQTVDEAIDDKTEELKALQKESDKTEELKALQKESDKTEELKALQKEFDKARTMRAIEQSKNAQYAKARTMRAIKQSQNAQSAKINREKQLKEDLRLLNDVIKPAVGSKFTIGCKDIKTFYKKNGALLTNVDFKKLNINVKITTINGKKIYIKDIISGSKKYTLEYMKSLASSSTGATSIISKAKNELKFQTREEFNKEAIYITNLGSSASSISGQSLKDIRILIDDYQKVVSELQSNRNDLANYFANLQKECIKYKQEIMMGIGVDNNNVWDGNIKSVQSSSILQAVQGISAGINTYTASVVAAYQASYTSAKSVMDSINRILNNTKSA